MSRRILRCGKLLSQPRHPRPPPRLCTARPTASASPVCILWLHRPMASSATMSRSHPLTTAVVDAMQQLYPLEYADSAWDNVGLLLDNLAESAAAVAAAKPTQQRVLLTNDLTSDVVDEAIAHNVSTIVAYHPFIFRGLKSVTHKDPQQASLLRLAQHNISVYSPHTALDAGQTGINDWLAQKVCDATRDEHNYAYKPTIVKKVAANPAALPPHLAGPVTAGLVGYGRQIFFPDKPIHPHQFIRRFVDQLNGTDSTADAASSKKALRHVLVAAPRRFDADPDAREAAIRSVAVCAGSGMDLLRAAVVAAAKEQRTIDLFITGEISHHDALWAAANDIWVVCLLHSNSERRFLADRLRGQLEERLRASTGHASPDAPVVLVSERDRDPFQIWDTRDFA